MAAYIKALKLHFMLRAIEVDDIKPFTRLSMKFPPVPDRPADKAEVHLLTGVNGTGKTRILSLLAGIFGNADHFMRRGGSQQTLIRLSDRLEIPPNSFIAFDGRSVGDSNFFKWLGTVPAFAYGGGAYITDAQIAPLAEMPAPQRGTCLIFSRAPDASAIVLQAITNLKMTAAMEREEADARGDDKKIEPTRAVSIMRAIESAVSNITGLKFAFRVRSQPRIHLNVQWGRMDNLPFATLPDGLRQIIGWLVHAVVMLDAVQTGKGTPMATESVLILDEVESHLHPAWQRRILPAFQTMFPKAQIFVSTHSPFVIASLNVGWIHRLTMDRDGAVTVHPPKAASAGDSYVTVVEEIMGVDEWYDPETEALLKEFRDLRDAALARKDSVTASEVKVLGEKIAQRGIELQFLIKRELVQLDRQLAGASTP